MVDVRDVKKTVPFHQVIGKNREKEGRNSFFLLLFCNYAYFLFLGALCECIVEGKCKLCWQNSFPISNMLELSCNFFSFALLSRAICMICPAFLLRKNGPARFPDLGFLFRGKVEEKNKGWEFLKLTSK